MRAAVIIVLDIYAYLRLYLLRVLVQWLRFQQIRFMIITLASRWTILASSLMRDTGHQIHQNIDA